MNTRLRLVALLILLPAIVVLLQFGGVLALDSSGKIAPRSAAAESIAGDVDGDGVVDSIDAFLLLQFHAGIIGIGQPYSEKADVNNDQRVNAIDAARILQFHAGLIKTLNP
ncbi:MAG: hypothetical protein IIC90_06750 [Chloroflexi bacterium]|nr:hypothetical protein [Chloroflexota bacterium]